MKITLVLIASIISSICYRLGGWEKGNKLFRRIGCPLVTILAYLCLKQPSWGFWWAYVASFGALCGAISTYNDWITGGHEDWRCWAVTGLFYGLAFIPLYWAGVHWWAIGIRAVALGALITLLRENTGSDIAEEFGSGLLLTVSVPLLLI